MDKSKMHRYRLASGSLTQASRAPRTGRRRGRGRVFLVLLLLAVALFAAGRVKNARVGRPTLGRVTRIGATVGQNVTAFGDGVLFYDGATLRCISAAGGSTWSYQVGANAAYQVGKRRIAAWSGNDLYILSDRGRLLYNNKMPDTIQFAAVGETYAAVFCGAADQGVVTVIDGQGQTVDKIPIESLALQSLGFFTASLDKGAGQNAELMWMLGLNTSGTVISMQLSTFQPGRLSIGKTLLSDHLAYRVYDDGAGNLGVVTTREIQHYNYRGVSIGNRELIYGYALHDVNNERGLHRLLIPEQEVSRSLRIDNVRLVTDHVDRMLHLPVPCLDVRLGSRATYGISENTVYACRFGETSFESFALPIQVTAVLDMMEGNRAIVASGSDIYVIELPL